MAAKGKKLESHERELVLNLGELGDLAEALKMYGAAQRQLAVSSFAITATTRLLSKIEAASQKG